MSFYERIAKQGTQTLAVRMFIETSEEYVMHVLRLGSEVCPRCVTDTSQLFGEEAQLLKKSAVLFLHFAPSLRFTLSLQSAFYTQSVFYLWSAVCSPQSAFYTNRVLKGTIRFATQDDFQRNTQAGNVVTKSVLYNFCNIVQTLFPSEKSSLHIVRK